MVSVWVNIVLATAQMLIGVFAKSQALVADGVHSLSDLLSDFVLLAGLHSRKAPDADHQYGHQRYENAASLVLGLLLLAVGIGMCGLPPSSFTTLVHPHRAQHCLWVAIATGQPRNAVPLHAGGGATRALQHAGGQCLACTFDAASSLVVAIGIIGNLMGYPILDPVAALIVGFIVGKMGWSFAWNLAARPDGPRCRCGRNPPIRQTLLATSGVRACMTLRTRKMGDLILVDVHLEVDGHMNVFDAHDIAEQARDE
jgi:cation diffusion facilitator family transporter